MRIEGCFDITTRFYTIVEISSDLEIVIFQISFTHFQTTFFVLVLTRLLTLSTRQYIVLHVCLKERSFVFLSLVQFNL